MLAQKNKLEKLIIIMMSLTIICCSNINETKSMDEQHEEMTNIVNLPGDIIIKIFNTYLNPDIIDKMGSCNINNQKLQNDKETERTLMSLGIFRQTQRIFCQKLYSQEDIISLCEKAIEYTNLQKVPNTEDVIIARLNSFYCLYVIYQNKNDIKEKIKYAKLFIRNYNLTLANAKKKNSKISRRLFKKKYEDLKKEIKFIEGTVLSNKNWK